MKKIFVLALALAMFLCGCQSQPDDTMLSYDGPYVDLIAVDVPEMADGEVSIIKVDSETGSVSYTHLTLPTTERV